MASSHTGIDLALPPSIWVGLHIEDLEDIFGAQAALKLYQAAEDPYCASEVATSASSSNGTQDTFDSFSDSSSSGFYSEEDWPALDLPEYEQDISFLQYDKPFGHLEDSRDGKNAQILAPYAQQSYPDVEDHHLIPETDAMVANVMDYRHCDSDCAFCGLCSDRFAERLTERLLMHGALVAM